MHTLASRRAPARHTLPTVSRRSSLGRRILRIARVAGLPPEAIVLESLEAGAFGWENDSDYRRAERTFRSRASRRRAAATNNRRGRR